MDNRRFYLTYGTGEIKRFVMGKGFFLGSIHIRAFDDVIQLIRQYPSIS